MDSLRVVRLTSEDLKTPNYIWIVPLGQHTKADPTVPYGLRATTLVSSPDADTFSYVRWDTLQTVEVPLDRLIHPKDVVFLKRNNRYNEPQEVERR